MKHFDPDRDEVNNRARETGIALMVTVGIDIPDSQAALDLAKKERGMFCAVGIHPHDASKLKEKDLNTLEEFSQDEKVVAIGEIGLDFYRNLSPREVQRAAFLQQLGVAKKLKKPVIIHCRDAYKELIELILDSGPPDKGGVVHCFSGDWDSAKAFLDFGFFLSFAGNITYPQAYELREVLKRSPMEKILMETDAPFLTPQPEKGKRNEPAFVKYTYRQAAEIKGLHLSRWAETVFENALKIFGLFSFFS